jgi:hypothetical protein
MKKTTIIALLLLALSDIANANKDVAITLEQDGSITNLPSNYSPASLKIKSSFFSMNSLSSARLNLGKNHLDLPTCILAQIKSKNINQITLSGSWHFTNLRLPHYLFVSFYEPDYDKNRHENAEFRIMVNMQTAKIMRMEHLSVNINKIVNTQKLTPSKICSHEDLESISDLVQW